MNATTLRALVAADSRALWRDPLLGWIVGLPFGVALLLRVLLPRVRAGVLDAAGVDLEPYYRLIMSGYLMTAPAIVGMVIGFVLLDERDARTLSALRVTPLSMRQYLAYRIVLPVIVGTLTTLVGYAVVGVVRVPPSTLVVIAALAAMTGPIVALILAIGAPNKVAGFAVVKVLSGVNLIPIVAFFVDPPTQFLAGVLPGFWAMRALWAAAVHESWVESVVIGFVVSALTLTICARLFERRLLERA